MVRLTALSLFAFMLMCGCGGEVSRGDPQELVKSGWNEYRLGHFAQAIEKFEHAVSLSPEKSDAHLLALYGLATTWNLRRPDEDRVRAAELYNSLLAQAPQHDLAAWSLLALARMKHVVPAGTDPDYAEVRKAYQQCIERFPNHPASEEAFIYQQSTLVATLGDDDARAARTGLEEFIRTRPKSPMLSPAYALLARCYLILHEPDKMVAAKINALNTMERDPLNPLSDKAFDYWTIAAAAEFEAGDFATAREYYRKLIEEYPTDMRKYGAKVALTRMDALEARLRAESAHGAGGKVQ